MQYMPIHTTTSYFYSFSAARRCNSTYVHTPTTPNNVEAPATRRRTM